MSCDTIYGKEIMLGKLIESNSEITVLHGDVCIARVNIAFFTGAKI